MINKYRKNIIITIITVFLLLISSSSVFAGWNHSAQDFLNYADGQGWLYLWQYRRSSRDDWETTGKGIIIKNNNYLLPDDDTELYTNSKILLSNGSVREDYYTEFSYDETDMTATDMEAFMLYFANEDKYMHTLVQNAWYWYMSTGGRGTPSNDNVASFIEAAREYANYMAEIRNKLQEQGITATDLSTVSDEQLQAAVDELFKVEYNGNVSVIKESDGDYLLVSDLTSHIYTWQMHVDIPQYDSDGNLTGYRCIKPSFGYQSDIEVEVQKKDGTKQILSYKNGDFELELQDESKHNSMNNSNDVTDSCRNGNEEDLRHGVRSTSEYYPLPYYGEKFNIKIKADKITNGNANDTNPVVQINSISLVSSSLSDSLGLLSIKYNNLTSVYSMKNSDFRDYKRANSGTKLESVDASEYRTASLDYLKADSILAMQEKQIDFSSEVYADIAAVTDDLAITSSDDKVTIDEDNKTIYLNLYDLENNLSSQDFKLKITEGSTLTGEGVHCGEYGALDYETNKRVWNCFIEYTNGGTNTITVTNESGEERVYRINTDVRVEKTSDNNTNVKYTVYNRRGNVTDIDGNTEGTWKGMKWSIVNGTNYGSVITFDKTSVNATVDFVQYFKTGSVVLDQITVEGKGGSSDSETNYDIVSPVTDNVSISGNTINISLGDLTSNLSKQTFDLRIKDSSDLNSYGVHVGDTSDINSGMRRYRFYLTDTNLDDGEDPWIEVDGERYDINTDMRIEKLTTTYDKDDIHIYINYRIYNYYGSIMDKSDNTSGTIGSSEKDKIEWESKSYSSYARLTFKINEEEYATERTLEKYFQDEEGRYVPTIEFLSNGSVSSGETDEDENDILKLSTNDSNVTINQNTDTIEIRLATLDGSITFSVNASNYATLNTDNLARVSKQTISKDESKYEFVVSNGNRNGKITVKDEEGNEKTYTVDTQCFVEEREANTLKYYVYNTIGDVKDTDGNTSGSDGNLKYSIDNTVTPPVIIFDTTLMNSEEVITLNEGFFKSGDKKVNTIVVSKGKSDSLEQQIYTDSKIGITVKLRTPNFNENPLYSWDLRVEKITFEDGKVFVYMKPNNNSYTIDSIKTVYASGESTESRYSLTSDGKIVYQISDEFLKGGENIFDSYTDAGNLVVTFKSPDNDMIERTYAPFFTIDRDTFEIYKNNHTEVEYAYSDDNFEINVTNYDTYKIENKVVISNEPTVTINGDDVTMQFPIQSGNINKIGLKDADSNVTITVESGNIVVKFKKSYINSKIRLWLDGVVNDSTVANFTIDIKYKNTTNTNSEYKETTGIYTVKIGNYNSNNGELKFITNPIELKENSGKLEITLENTYKYEILSLEKGEGIEFENKENNTQVLIKFDNSILLSKGAIYGELKTKNGELIGIGISLSGVKGIYTATEEIGNTGEFKQKYGVTIWNYVSIPEVGIENGKFIDSQNDNLITFKFKLTQGNINDVKVVTRWNDDQSPAETGTSDSDIQQIRVESGYIYITYYKDRLNVGNAGEREDGINADKLWKGFILSGDDVENIQINIQIDKYNPTVHEGDISVENIGKDAENSEVQAEASRNNNWINEEVEYGGLHELSEDFFRKPGNGQQDTNSEILEDNEIGQTFESLQTVTVRKKGFLKASDDVAKDLNLAEEEKYYVRLQFEDQDAVSYEINYRFNRLSGELYAGDGAEGSAIYLENANSDGKVYSTSAVVRVQRAGESAITVKYKDGSAKIVIIYIPQLYVGEVKDSTGKDLTVESDDWMGTGQYTGEALYGDTTLNAQFEVGLDETETELTFYNITGGVGLSNYTYGLGGTFLGEGNNDWASTQKAWKEALQNNTNLQINGEAQEYDQLDSRRISETYSLDVSVSADIEGFESITNGNYVEMLSGNHKLKWSFRDTEVREATTEGATLGSTFFSVIFVPTGDDIPTNVKGDVIYVKEIYEWKPAESSTSLAYEGMISFTTTISGRVWIESDSEDKEVADSIYGRFDNTDSTDVSDIVTANLYRYDAKNGTTKELVTSLTIGSDGKYSETRLPPLSVSGSNDYYYGVEFTYDGQQYEPTEFLTAGTATYNQLNTTGDAEVSARLDNMISSRPSSYSSYMNSSYAVENSNTRATFDGELNEIDGEDSQANTAVTYDTKDSDGTRKAESNISSTHNITASTYNANMQYPLSEDRTAGYHLMNNQSTISVDRGNSADTHYPIQEYFNQINFGLVKRDYSDLSVIKDMYQAKVIINEQELNYIGNNLIALQKDENGNRIGTTKTYTLGLYQSDLEYSSDVYNSAADVIKNIKANTELKAYITYRISIANESANTVGVVNTLDEYYDQNYTLVTERQTANILEKTSNYTDNSTYDIERIEKTVAYPSYYRIIRDTTNVPTYNYNKDDDTNGYENGDIIWTNLSESTILGTNYNKVSTSSLNGVRLNPGQEIEVFVTYEVNNKEELKTAIQAEGVDKISQDMKTITEIANYSTQYGRRKNATSAYTTGTNSGKIDRDSRPSNVIDAENENQFEDDTGFEGKLTINVQSKEESRRTISGTVWEDLWIDGSYNGNGLKDEGESKIKDIDVMLIEKIYDDDGNEYEYAWTTNNGDVILDQEQDINKATIHTDTNGVYSFSNVVSGIYSIRFIYGNTETNVTYNGQDYKNTSYQSGVTGSDLNQEWHDLSDQALENANVSDARDYEPQRLRTIAYSRTISNENAEHLAAKDETMRDNTYMIANTAKLYMEVEKQSGVGYVNDAGTFLKTTINDEGTFVHTYAVNNIDFGLEKRPETGLELGKDLTEITLTKNDDSSVIFKVTLENGQVINRESGTAVDKIMTVIPNNAAQQGFHYITIEDSYLNNLSVKLNYNITVTNSSNPDYVGSDLAALTKMEEIYKVAAELEKSGEYVTGKGIKYGSGIKINGASTLALDDTGNRSVEIENLLGNYYYTHNVGANDTQVTTTVDQIVDYIDNDIGLNEVENTNVENHAWTTADIGSGNAEDELKGLISSESFGSGYLSDYRGVSYFGTNKSNLALSVNNNIGHKQGNALNEYTYHTYIKDITASNNTLTYTEGTGTITATQARYTIDRYSSDTYNPGLTTQLLPNASASIGISMSKTASSGADADNLKFDNLAEILVYSNTVGRKDAEAIPGNANEIAKLNDTSATWQAGHSSGTEEKTVSGTNVRAERDADATEYVTLTEPTGLSFSMERANKTLIVTIVAICTMIVAIIAVPVFTVMYDKSRRKRETE